MMNIKKESVMSSWVRCPECGSRIRKDGDGYYCKECETWYSNDELESGDVYIDNNSDTPAVCQACGGPYPACSIDCNLLDDD